ncbi:MAG: tetratricopeptide repeat protein [Archangium sp.]|nr:tetratricopeptide repeat protein [Archangium sp.]
METLAQEFGFTPDQLEALRSKAFDLVDAGDHDGAVVVFHGLLAIDPNEAANHAALGSVLQELGKIDEAVASYDEAIKLEAYSPLARVNRGELRLKQGDSKGIEDLRIAAARKSPVQARAQSLLRRFGG